MPTKGAGQRPEGHLPSIEMMAAAPAGLLGRMIPYAALVSPPTTDPDTEPVGGSLSMELLA